MFRSKHVVNAMNKLMLEYLWRNIDCITIEDIYLINTRGQSYLKCRRCTYNVILRRVRATIVPVEKQSVLQELSVCICYLRYPTRSAHAL